MGGFSCAVISDERIGTLLSSFPCSCGTFLSVVISLGLALGARAPELLLHIFFFFIALELLWLGSVQGRAEVRLLQCAMASKPQIRGF